MVSEVIAAVSTAIYNEFGSDYRIYSDNIEQGLTRPCFFINVIRQSNDEKLMGRSFVSIPLVIQYFPESQGKRTECYAVGDRLFNCLRYPEFNGEMYRGDKMRCDVKDDKLNFHVQYDFYTLTVNDKDTLMYDVSESIDSKREDDE